MRNSTGHRQSRDPESEPLLSSPVKPELESQRPTTAAYIILLLSCIVRLGETYCAEIPGALASALKEHLKLSSSQWIHAINAIYMVNSIPNLITPIFVGTLLDYFSPFPLMPAFAAVSLVGQTGFAMAVHTRSIPLILVTQLLTGLGQASELVQVKILNQLFPHHVGFAFGITLAAGRLSGAASENISPVIYKRTGDDIDWPNLIGCAVTLLSVGAAVVILRLPRWVPVPELSVVEDLDQDVDKLPNTSRFGQFQPAFWVLCGACMLAYGTVPPYIHILQGYLEEKFYPGDPLRAARVMSIPGLVTTFATPLFGALLDAHGGQLLTLAFSFVLIFIVHGTIMVGFISPAPIMVLLGIAFATFTASLWPLVPQLVPLERLGIGYGFFIGAMNVGLLISPVIISVLKVGGGWEAMELGFCVAAVGGMVLALTARRLRRESLNICIDLI